MEMRKVRSAASIDADRVAALDIGGTLTSQDEKGSAAYELNTALGVGEEREREIYRFHKDETGGIGNYMEHAAEVTEAIIDSEPKASFRDYAETVQELIRDREVMEDAEKFVKNLEDQGFHTMAVSCAPISVAYPLADKAGCSSLYIFRDYIFHEDEFKGIYVNPRAQEGKEQIVKTLQDNDIEVFYAGNGGSDVLAEEQADIGVIREDWTENPGEAFEEALEAI